MDQRECEENLQQRIGHVFAAPELLRESLTHRSFSNEQPLQLPHNERLEFLGDAVLDLVISHLLFRELLSNAEGELTRIRAEVVSERSLARIGRHLDLGECLLLGRGEERSGGRDKDSLLADALEALLGAVFCDAGFERARDVTERLFAEAIGSAVERKAGLDFKTRLQELLQGRFGRPPEYFLARSEGPDHQRLHTVEVRFDGRTIGSGRSRTKKGAEQEAAREALEHLGG